ncbi:zinc ribbon domain-containing protein [Acidipila sp. EB88]|uniref:zinc ribbon domain-containing protein n=1 Tax=Acidipila sp. EB88 TaxID=2305226 RepID=UPI000FC0F19F|nr:zinc ribbon domain-containing protein [Acidipila sp. EB88]RRA48071.1 zinc ribbon domain-containing protein [Acidipila sp. EB88]
MMRLCHNCRNAVPEHAAFCPECGAPQLRVPGPESREAETETPGGDAPARLTGDIAWPAAVQSAAIYAVPAGLLLSFVAIPLVDMAWVVLGAMWTLRRYRRRVPKAPALTPQLGGRIGLVLGLFAALITMAIQALGLLSARFVLHQGPSLDAQVRTEMQSRLDQMVAMYPDTFAQLPEMRHFWLSAEGQGAVLLVGAATSLASILFFAWLGGRLWVRFGSGRKVAG